MSQQVYCNVATLNVTIPSIVTKTDLRIKKLRLQLGKLIRESREAKKFSQDGLAKLVDMERQQIYRIENGLSGTTKETLLSIADALDMKADKLLALSAGIEEDNQSEIRKPRNVAEFYDRLDEMGLGIKFDGGSKSLEGLDADDLQDLLDSIQAVTMVKINKKIKANTK